MGKHKGFTIIEVALFLVVTAALFVGIALGMRTTIFRQKYEDSVTSFLEFMRSIYSQVANTQSQGKGNSDQAIYGKLVVFGENTDLLGNTVNTDSDIEENGQQIFVYDVVGDAGSTRTLPSGDVLISLGGVGANVVRVEKKEGVGVGNERIINLASPETYTPRWSAVIQETSGVPMKKSILVVRHPRSGTVNTLIYDNAIQVNETFYAQKSVCEEGKSECKIEKLLTDKFPDFKTNEIDFCVWSDELGRSSFSSRQDIRLINNARNSSSVLRIEMDGGDNRCSI